MTHFRLPLLLSTVLCSLVLSAQDFAGLDAATGKAIFEKLWVQAPASTGASDGLGPFYNSRSCAACHPDGGRGLLPQGRVLQLDDHRYGKQLQTSAVTGLKAEAQLQWITESNAQGLDRPLPVLVDRDTGPLIIPSSVRMAPPLHGVGLLSTVPVSALEILADPDDSDADGISGRIAWLESGTGQAVAGRYGWKASEPSLQAQIARALSLDLGLGNPLYPDHWGDCTALQHDCLAAPAGLGPDEQFEAGHLVMDMLESYLQSLLPPTPEAMQQRGYGLFRQSGCAACHIEELASAMGQIKAWSDLLLHDMGPGLADSLPVPHALPAEWRTAPLWGLDSGPYLHDGRARTLDEAIRWHAGEAASATEAYLGLNEAEREDLFAFLLGL